MHLFSFVGEFLHIPLLLGSAGSVSIASCAGFALPAMAGNLHTCCQHIISNPVALWIVLSPSWIRRSLRYPDVLRGPVSVTKAQEVLRWSPTTLTKALRSVARFYERIMLENEKHKKEIEQLGWEARVYVVLLYATSESSRETMQTVLWCQSWIALCLFESSLNPTAGKVRNPPSEACILKWLVSLFLTETRVCNVVPGPLKIFRNFEKEKGLWPVVLVVLGTSRFQFFFCIWGIHTAWSKPCWVKTVPVLWIGFVHDMLNRGKLNCMMNWMMKMRMT